ncbi:hypothetical protein ACWIE7_07560 [Dietzia sp. NPDC055343]
MDVSTLHAASEDFAAHLSEVTPGDMAQPVHGGGTVSGLVHSVLDETDVLSAAAVRAATANPPEIDPVSEAEAAIATFGHLPESGYRRAAAVLILALSEVDASRFRCRYRIHVCTLVSATHRLAAALGLVVEADDQLLHDVRGWADDTATPAALTDLFDDTVGLLRSGTDAAY